MGGQEMREGVGVRGKRGRGEKRDWMAVRKYCIKCGVALKEGVGLWKNISRGGAGQRGDKQISSSGAVTLMKLLKNLGEELFFFLS